jgi:rhomboid protease GluP
MIQRGEWWRLVTAGFLHGGIFHFLMNSWVLFDLGAHTEESYGTPRFLVFYFVSTITGFYASYWWAPGTLSIGSSAGIFGLIGAMIALGLRDGSLYGSAIRRMYTQWAIYGLLMGLLFPFTDNAAHIGGIIGGFAMGYIAGTPRMHGAQETFWKAAAGAALVLTAASFAIMFRHLVSGG